MGWTFIYHLNSVFYWEFVNCIFFVWQFLCVFPFIETNVSFKVLSNNIFNKYLNKFVLGNLMFTDKNQP